MSSGHGGRCYRRNTTPSETTKNSRPQGRAPAYLHRSWVRFVAGIDALMTQGCRFCRLRRSLASFRGGVFQGVCHVSGCQRATDGIRRVRRKHIEIFARFYLRNVRKNRIPHDGSLRFSLFRRRRRRASARRLWLKPPSLPAANHAESLNRVELEGCSLRLPLLALIILAVHFFGSASSYFTFSPSRTIPTPSRTIMSPSL